MSTCLRAGPARHVCKRGMGRASSFSGHHMGVRKRVIFVTRDIKFLARQSKCGTGMLALILRVPGGDYHSSLLTPLIPSTSTHDRIVIYSRGISPGTSPMTVDLNWENSANSLSRALVASDEPLVPYYDLSDGQMDRRIALSISRSTG